MVELPSGTCTDPPLGPALLSWDTIIPHPTAPCPGDAPGSLVHPQLKLGALSAQGSSLQDGAIPPLHPWAEKPSDPVGFGARGMKREEDVVGAEGAAGVQAGWRGLPVTARLHLPGHARVTPDALEVPCSNFNFIVSQSFSGSS